MSGSSRPRSAVSQSGTERANPEKPISSALRRYAWFVLAYTVLVVVWGTIVRATGSGGGCGDHWPLCNGVVLPQLARFHTVVEFTHRAMSGVSLALIAILLIGTWRATRRGHFARWASGAAMILVLNEALLGALLVLLQLVGHNASQARSIYLSLHFANTLLLLAALALAAEFLSRPRIRGNTALRHGKLLFPALGILATLFVGVSGSLAALGDTLFPSLSLSSAFHQDFSSSGSLLLRLRWLHPASALIAGLFMAWLLVQAFRRSGTPRMRALGIVVLCSLLAQYALGAADVLLLAPVWLQALHLLNGDILWITFILLTASYCLIEKPARERLTVESGKFAEAETIAAEAAASLNA